MARRRGGPPLGGALPVRRDGRPSAAASASAGAYTRRGGAGATAGACGTAAAHAPAGSTGATSAFPLALAQATLALRVGAAPAGPRHLSPIVRPGTTVNTTRSPVAFASDMRGASPL